MVRYLSVRRSGTRWFGHQVLRDGFGLGASDIRHGHVGGHQIVPLHPWIAAGEKVVVLKYDPVLHAIGCANLGWDLCLHAFPVMADWARYYEHVHEFDVLATDHTSEIAKLSAFLGLEPTGLIDWAPAHQSDDTYGLRAEYLQTGVVPDCIQRVMNELGVA